MLNSVRTILLVNSLLFVTSSGFSLPDYNQASYMLTRQKQINELRQLLSHPHEKAHKLASQLFLYILEMFKGHHALVSSVKLEEAPINATIAEGQSILFDTVDPMVYALDHLDEGLAFVIENTPLLLQLALLFPDAVHPHVDQQEPIMDVLRWAISVTQQSGFIPESEQSLFTSAQHELNLIPRPADYRNPHTAQSQMAREAHEAEILKRQAKKERRKLKKGPKLTPKRVDL
ncbi:hypothetical protein P879_08971 [Paragonimus westermani]|uniref:Coiled-coil domain-containing protein 134 n=1 Tax=Paragonimus westermani TaxID=34504 RepID=A0A8T0DDM7_9TREM|nr:hypothetical protein P879_08971 [Paragonimus westermani]